MASVIDDIKQRISTENVVIALRIATRDILPVAGKRIFVTGHDAAGTKIGDYSTKPIYISKKNSPRVAGRDTGKSLFFPGGYKQFKTAIGRGPDVNLRLFGRLEKDYLTSKETVNGTRITYSLKAKANADKMEFAEKHFNTDITSLTASEEKKLKEVFTFELLKRIAND